MNKTLLYLLIPNLLITNTINGGEAAQICGRLRLNDDAISYSSYSTIKSASQLSSAKNDLDLQAALAELYCSDSSASSVSIGAKRLRDVSQSPINLSSDDDLSDFESVSSSGSCEYDDEEPNQTLDLAEILAFKEHGCDLAHDKEIDYEHRCCFVVPPSVKDAEKAQAVSKAKSLLEKAISSSDSKELTDFVTFLRKNPKLPRWFDKNGQSLADHLVELVCHEENQEVNRDFLEKVLKRNRSACTESANPVFRKFHAAATAIQKSTSLSLAEDELTDGESDGELKARRIWSICKIKNQVNEHLFEESDLKLAARKSQAAKDLIVAIHKNNIEEIDRLIAANPKLPFYCNAKRYFPLQYAAVKNPDVIRKLVEAGVPVEHSYDGMLTPLQLAVIYGNVKAVKELISLGANPHERIYAGESLRPSTLGDADAMQLARKLSAGRQPNGVRVLRALLEKSE